jgi:hypothetical protein
MLGRAAECAGRDEGSPCSEIPRVGRSLGLSDLGGNDGRLCNSTAGSCAVTDELGLALLAPANGAKFAGQSRSPSVSDATILSPATRPAGLSCCSPGLGSG